MVRTLFLRWIVICTIISHLQWKLAAEGVVLNEIMYNPLLDNLQYIELFNPTKNSVPVKGFEISGDIQFKFPQNQDTLAAGGYLVVAANVKTFLSSYGHKAYGTTFAIGPYGPWKGKLSKDGGKVEVKHTNGLSLKVKYSGDNKLSSNFGSSLELLCVDFDGSKEEHWRASPMSTREYPNAEYSGSPGRPNHLRECNALTLPPTLHIHFSEVMYHPVKERALQSEHEFIEMYNDETQTTRMGGYRLNSKKGVRFVFPTNAQVNKKSYFIIAKNPAAFKKIYKTNVPVFGPYKGELSNGGDRLVLVSDNGVVVDYMKYEDDFPWPYRADAFGAGSDWLRGIDPLKHQYKGVSLQRISFKEKASKVYNWVDDFPQPGKPTANKYKVMPVVDDISLKPKKKDITFQDDVEVTVEFTHDDVALSKVAIVYRTLNPITMVRSGFVRRNMVKKTSGKKVKYTYKIPKAGANIIREYHIEATPKSDPKYVIRSPRATDVMQEHMFFYSKPVTHKAEKFFQLFLTRAVWGKLWSNIKDGRNFKTKYGPRCGLSATWNIKEQGYVVHEGDVTLVMVRHQGNKGGRLVGMKVDPKTLKNGPLPSDGLKALNYRVEMPSYAKVDGKEILLFHKIDRAPGRAICPHVTSPLLYETMSKLNLMSLDVTYARLHINDNYFRYAMLIEVPRDMDVYREEQLARCPHKQFELTPHVYKSQGCFCTDAALGFGDYRPLKAACGFNVNQRYEATYNLKTLKGTDPNSMAIQTLVKGLNEYYGAKKGDNKGLRAYLAKNFDVNYMLNYFSVLQWGVPTDDTRHNHFLVRRRSDKRYVFLAWDADYMFFNRATDSTIYMGNQGSLPSYNTKDYDFSRIKDLFFKGYRNEFRERIRYWAEKLLKDTNMKATLETIKQRYQNSEQKACVTPYEPKNVVGQCLKLIKPWLTKRYKYIKKLGQFNKKLKPSLCYGTTITPQFSAYKGPPGQIRPPQLRMVKNTGKILIRYDKAIANGVAVSTYHLQREPKGVVRDPSTKTYQFVDKGAVTGKEYMYRVRARDTSGAFSMWSSWSAKIKVTNKSPPPTTPVTPPATPIKAPITPTKAPITPTKTPVTPTKAPLTPTKNPVPSANTPAKSPITPTQSPSDVNHIKDDDGSGLGTGGVVIIILGIVLVLAIATTTVVYLKCTNKGSSILANKYYAME